MLLLAFRSFFFIAVILGYSTGIWRLINDYFRREFQSYLQVESQTNQYLLRDPPKTVLLAPDMLNKQLPAEKEQDGRHQQVTDSIMTLSQPITTTPSGPDARTNGKVSNLRDLDVWDDDGGSVSKSKGERPPDTVALQEEETVTTLPVTTAVVAVAEASDIRPPNGKQSLSKSMKQRKGDQPGQQKDDEEGENDKWISYWSERKEGGDGQMDDNANAYCTVAGVGHSNAEVLGGAVNRIRELIVDDDGFGCD